RALLARWLIMLMTFTPAWLVLFLTGPSLWFAGSLVLAITFVIVEVRMLRPDGVPPSLLGLSALHLILFVALQNIDVALTG
ncbi:MAG: hypothetical protein ACON38_11735, partial [Akkermansiaceae bacterium]